VARTCIFRGELLYAFIGRFCTFYYTTYTVSEYHIGHTIYRVKTVFNPAFRQSLSDILARLITADCEKMLGDNEQEQDKQAV